MRRRSLLIGLGAAMASPNMSWADALNPAFLSAARAPDGSYHLCGLTEAGALLFTIPLPERGHAAAAHPTRPEAVAFARRPGRFAVIVACASGEVVNRLVPPPDRHFYGHGAFSSDGSILFTTENDLETLEGRIGLWDAAAGYARIGDIPSGGIGPHDIARLPGSDTLVVANGGIATHPDSGRTPLNPATMRANLAYIAPSGLVLDRIELEPALRQNSIRHLDIRPDGLVVAGLQWNGAEAEHPPLVLTHNAGGPARLLAAPPQVQRTMRGYVGSIALLRDGQHVAVTSPRGGTMHLFDVATGAFLRSEMIPDVCGITATPPGHLLVTTGTGAIQTYDADRRTANLQTRWSWDNHIVRV